MRRLRSLIGFLLWLVLIAVIAFGASGLVTAFDHLPGTPARADLTAAGDAEVSPILDAADANLATLSDRVEALATQARGALAALNSADTTTSEAAIAQGDKLVVDITARTRSLRAELTTVPYAGTPEAGLFLSDAVIARRSALVAALDATTGLDVAWLRLTVGSVAATKMSGLLATHDSLVGQAATQGRQAKYAAGLKLLTKAQAELTAARALRDQLANTVDVTTLDEWVKRNADYDNALAGLYKQIAKVGTKVTAATRAAVKAEAAARARLPPDTRGLVLIMAEIGKGGMNGAVIAIEEARAGLNAALEADQPGPSGGPGASSGPDASDQPAASGRASPSGGS